MSPAALFLLLVPAFVARVWALLIYNRLVRLRHAAAEAPLAAGLSRLFAIAENYPALKADAHFLALQRELAETENRIAAARRFFNANVRDLNTLREQFPTLIVAGATGFRAADFFQLDSAAERVVTRV